VGSLSHKTDTAGALVAYGLESGYLGLDIETCNQSPPRVDVARRVLSDVELSWLETQPEPRRHQWVRLGFSLKEAIYKSIYPRLRRYVGFREVSLDFSELPSSPQLLGMSQECDISVTAAPVDPCALGVRFFSEAGHFVSMARFATAEET
jgi:enterobactin synthetase component D